jgi:hypothetical protein
MSNRGGMGERENGVGVGEGSVLVIIVLASVVDWRSSKGVWKGWAKGSRTFRRRTFRAGSLHFGVPGHLGASLPQAWRSNSDDISWRSLTPPSSYPKSELS